MAGAVVECYQYDIRGAFFAAPDMEVKQRVTTGTNGAFEFQVPAVTTVLVGRKPGLAAAWAQYWNLTKDDDGPAPDLHAAPTLTGAGG